MPGPCHEVRVALYAVLPVLLLSLQLLQEEYSVHDLPGRDWPSKSNKSTCQAEEGGQQLSSF